MKVKDKQSGICVRRNGCVLQASEESFATPCKALRMKCLAHSKEILYYLQSLGSFEIFCLL